MTTPTESGAGSKVRQEAREWVTRNWEGKDDAQWRLALLESGWKVPAWPADLYGRGLSFGDALQAEKEFKEVGAVGGFFGVSVGALMNDILGAVLLTYATEEQKERILRPLLLGELGNLCLLYSEPGAGSDLAAAQTRAERVGDEFVINGQKIWSSLAQYADWGLLMARTDWDVPKHAGLSYFLINMHQEGIEVRPIKQATGDAEFNEVFLTDARLPACNLLGALNDGWRVMQVALVPERRTRGKGAKPITGRQTIFSSVASLIDEARAAGLDQDPVVRDELMRILAWKSSLTWLNERAAAGLSGGSSSPLASFGKLANSRVLHRTGALRFRLQGMKALVYDKESDPQAYEVDHSLIHAFANSIAAGTDQIMRNIIAERVLGLPRVPDPDKGIPFRDARKSSATRTPNDAN